MELISRSEASYRHTIWREMWNAVARRISGSRNTKTSGIAAGIHRTLRLRSLAPLQTAGWLQCLSRFFLSAFFQRRLARKFYAASVVDADAFDPNHIADLDYVLGAFHSKIGELGNVHQSVFAWENFHKRPK